MDSNNMDLGLWDELDLAGLSGAAASSEFVIDDSFSHLSAENSAGESSSSATLSNSPQQAVVPHRPIAIAPSNAVTKAPPKKKLERRGHFKSRNGCFNCKKRRIKVSTTVSRFLFRI